MIVKQTENFSAAQLEAVLVQSGILAHYDEKDIIEKDHIINAIRTVRSFDRGYKKK